MYINKFNVLERCLKFLNLDCFVHEIHSILIAILFIGNVNCNFLIQNNNYDINNAINYVSSLLLVL